MQAFFQFRCLPMKTAAYQCCNETRKLLLPSCQQKDDAETREASVSLAARKAFSVDAAMALVLSELDGIFMLEEQRMP